MENTLDIFESNELCCELESRGFTVFDSTVDESVQEALSELNDDDLKVELSRRGFDYIFDNEYALIQTLIPDYLPELFDEMKDAGYFVIDADDKSVTTFRKNDCQELIEDVVKRRGWNFLYELLIKC